MRSQDKQKIAWYGALALLFSYFEMFFPKILPFFKPGLGNAAVLMALESHFPSFLVLLFVKSFVSSITSGTLFSPFFLLSLSQSFGSGILMFILNKIKGNWLGLTGISLLGSAISCVIQIFIASLYLGEGTFSLLAPMLLFSLFSGTITALIAIKLRDRFSVPEESLWDEKEETICTKKPEIQLLLFIFIALASAFIFMQKNLYVLFPALFICLILQKLSGRKIHFLPHFSMWLFVITASLFVPAGKILFTLNPGSFNTFSFSITETALLTGLKKSVQLSSAMALSQWAITLSPPKDSISAMTLFAYKKLCSGFSDSFGLKALFKKSK